MSQAGFKEKTHAVLNLLLRILKHVFVHNGWIKLIAVVISLVVWAGLISQDENLTRNKTFQISISKSAINNAKNTLNEKGFIITSDLEELLSNVTMTAAVPQTRYENATQNAYNVQIDVSGIKGVGEQELKLTSTDSTTYGKVISISPASIKVEVDKYESSELKCNLSIQGMSVNIRNSSSGSYYDGWYKDWYIRIPSNNIGSIVVKGADSLIGTIGRVYTELDVESIRWQEGSLNPTGRVYLKNKDGELIDTSLVNITRNNISSNYVQINVEIKPTVSFETRDLIQITGEVPEGYRIGEITTDPKTISIAAGSDVLDQLETLLTDRAVNLTDSTGTLTVPVKVQKPTDDCILSNETINVTVEIVPDNE